MWVLPPAVPMSSTSLVTACVLCAGDWEERVIVASDVLASLIYILAGRSVWGQDMPLQLGLDLCSLGLSVVISLRSDKIWPLLFASLALLESLTDLAQMLAHAHSWAFGTAQLTWELLSELALAWGTWGAWRRSRSRSRRGGRAPATA